MESKQIKSCLRLGGTIPRTLVFQSITGKKTFISVKDGSFDIYMPSGLCGHSHPTLKKLFDEHKFLIGLRGSIPL